MELNFDLEAKYHKLLANARMNKHFFGKEKSTQSMPENKFQNFPNQDQADHLFKSLNKCLKGCESESHKDPMHHLTYSPTKHYYDILMKSKTEQKDLKGSKNLPINLAQFSPIVSTKPSCTYKMLELQNEMGNH